MKSMLSAAAAAAFLSACSDGGSGVETPEALRGVWAADCSEPFVRVEDSRIHVYPDGKTYELKSAALEGANFNVSYDTPQGAISETYVVEGDTLRLASGTYGGQQATWQKRPMSKCG